MSTPAVAGAIALWLQANPTLTRDDIIGVLERTSRHPEEQLTYPNNHYGYGEIDAYRGLLDILGLTKIEGIKLSRPSRLEVFTQDGSLHILLDTTTRQPVRVRIFALTGELLIERQLIPTTSEVVMPLSSTIQGIVLVQTESQITGLTGSRLVRL